ncbi:MAG: VOC family protein [Bacteroidia bacterium]|jgi:PhnB protein|nr:VOC family protein [Bacteroidia bacterium]
MAKTSIYLNFAGNCEEAFNNYRKIFGTEFSGKIFRMKDSGVPNLPAGEANYIMNIALPILGGTVIMGTDMLESMGHKLKIGNNTTINLEADTRDEVDRLYKALSEGGSEMSPPADMFWGYWAVCLDRYGIRWMFNGPLKK